MEVNKYIYHYFYDISYTFHHIQRDLLRKTLQDRQVAEINDYINSYLINWRKISFAYPRVYSPCYAEPGWSEQTGIIFNLKLYLYTLINIYLFA